MVMGSWLVPTRDLERKRAAKATRFPAWRYAGALSAVIPGRREAANPESRAAKIPDVLDSGFTRCARALE